MPLPPDDIRARLAQLRSEFAMRAALQSEYDKEMSGKYIHEMIPFADWLAQRNAPTGKAKGGLAGFLEDSKVKYPMYHGSNRLNENGEPFSIFDRSKNFGFHVGTPEQAKNINIMNRGWGESERTKPNAYTMRVYIKAKNPLRVTDDQANDPIDLMKMLRDSGRITSEEYEAYRRKNNRDQMWTEDMLSTLARLGHDSLVYENKIEGKGDSYVLLKPNQIKSAIGNRGTYDPNDPDITKASGGSVMGINVASDRKAGRRYADLIVDGHKTLESRNGDSLRPYVGKRVAIVRTGEGPAKAIGEVTIGEPMVVNKKKFRSLEGQHHVPEGSAYDISTPTKHLYPLHDPVRYEKERDVGHGIVSRKVVHEASGGSIPSLDVMRLAIGGQGPRNWLKGSVERVLRPLVASQQAIDPESYLKASQNPLIGPATRAQLEDAYRDSLRHQSINQWIERNLGNYIRKQLGHPNDPIRKLAEEGVLHTDPTRVEIIGGDNDMGTHANRRREMFGGQKMAKGPLAQAWEDAVDTRFEGYKIKDLQNMPEMHEGQYEPWMDKADPNTLIFEPYAFDELGFDHLVDILKEDLAQGRIRPEQLSKVSIEQAVRRAHQYDQERKKAMAETALKATEGMPIHKDYGDGFKWIELAPSKEKKQYSAESLPEGFVLEKDRDGYYQVRNTNVGQTPTTDSFSRNPDEAMAKFNNWVEKNNKDFNLEQALKYEGDTMGHCVGGYTPDVASGKSRIFSLRDAKNEPHVTVEVIPNKMSPGSFIRSDDVPQSLLNRLEAAAPPGRGLPHDWEELVRASPEYSSKQQIRQIKGKGNAKPKKDYIPYVQDFVRSGNWSEVNDFRNTDLIRKSDLIDKFSPEELDAVGKGEYLTHGEHSDLLLKALQPPKGKAEGGITHAHHLEIEERKL